MPIPMELSSTPMPKFCTFPDGISGCADCSVATEQSAQPLMPSGNVQNFGMGVEDNSMGMGIDLGISLDDIFGNTDACRAGNGLPSDDWIQWLLYRENLICTNQHDISSIYGK